MNAKRSFVVIISLLCIVLILSVALLSASALPSVQAQGGATDQQQTIQAIVNQRFTQTAQAQQQVAMTQTIDAAFNQALTATAGFQNTVDAQFNQALTATAIATITPISSATGVKVLTPVAFPTVPPGGTVLTLDGTYFQPSALFSIPHIIGWELPLDGEERTDPAQGSTISRAGVTFINSPALSVVHVFAERDPNRKAKAVADLDAYYDKTNLDQAWSNFTGGYKETGRRTDGDKFIINFELYLNGNTYLGRQVSQFDGDWLKVSRLVTPSNNPALMDALQTTIWAAFTLYPVEASLPLAWPAITDPVLGYAIRYRPEWTSIAGGAAIPNIVGGPLRAATITMTTRAELGKVVQAEADARSWVTSLITGATIQTVQPTRINGVNGFNVSFNYSDADGNPRSAVATLLNGPNGMLYTITFISTAYSIDLLGSDPSVPPELSQLRATFIIIPTNQLVPTLTPTVTLTSRPNSTALSKLSVTPLIADNTNSPCYNATPLNIPIPANVPKQFIVPKQVIDPTHTYCAFLTTAHGVIVIELFAKSAPKHVNSFVFLANQGYFDGITWHRVIPGFMAQTGDPTGTGSGGPGYSIPLEINPALHYDKPGVLGMARTSDPNSAGSQFFITFAPQPSLDSQYTIFGQVVRGMSVLQQIATRNVDQNPNLPPGDTLISVRTTDVTAAIAYPTVTPIDVSATEKATHDSSMSGTSSIVGTPITLPDGLQYVDVTVGTGDTAVVGKTVDVSYTGKLDNGTVFDTNEGKTPLEFQLGTGQVIKGWDEGIEGMKVGGERQLTIPAALGYGSVGQGPIPPNAILHFDVKLVAVK